MLLNYLILNIVDLFQNNITKCELNYKKHLTEIKKRIMIFINPAGVMYWFNHLHRIPSPKSASYCEA